MLLLHECQYSEEWKRKDPAFQKETPKLSQIIQHGIEGPQQVPNPLKSVSVFLSNINSLHNSCCWTKILNDLFCWKLSVSD